MTSKKKANERQDCARVFERMCVCVRVCVKEKERERERKRKRKIDR
jgi:hypothetical protein